MGPMSASVLNDRRRFKKKAMGRLGIGQNLLHYLVFFFSSQESPFHEWCFRVEFYG